MLKFIFGLIILIIPLFLINRFEDKKKGAYAVLAGILGLQFLIALITQIFGVFTYFNILILNLIVCSVVIFKTDFSVLKEKLKEIKIDWVFIFVLLVCVISLYAVHNDYTGKITTLNQAYVSVENFNYPYPYFSDEWVGVSFIAYSITSGHLPLVNTLWYNSPYPNIAFAISTFGSEFVLLLGLNPLTSFVWFSFFAALLICSLVYFILRENGVDKFSSAVSSILVLYITSGANLPGLWTFIPLIGGIVFLLFAILFISIKENKLVVYSSILSLAFYPPLLVFFIPLLLVYYFFYEKNNHKHLFWFVSLTSLVGILFVLSLRFFGGISAQKLFSYISSRLFYGTFTTNAIPDYSIWKVVFWFVLVFAFIGVFKIYKSKFWLIAPIGFGLIYWLIYSTVLWRLIIEYERVVVTTSILITLIAGFGIAYFLEFLGKDESIKKYNIILIIKVVVLIGLFFMAFSYTEINNWEKLQLHTNEGKVIYPAAPANQYLTQGDLDLFKNISRTKFLTVPWKGLVLGVATNNYPIDSKQSTVGNNFYEYSQFMQLDCGDKMSVAKKVMIDYVYSAPINCSGFNQIGKSSEGFILYSVNSSR